MAFQCNLETKCMRCAGPHSTKDCTDKTSNKCANCQGEHSANSSLCPKVKEAKAVQETRKISYATATAKKGDPTDVTRLASCLVEILHTLLIKKAAEPPTCKSICDTVAFTVSRLYKTSVSTHHLSSVLQALDRLAPTNCPSAPHYG